MLWQFTIAPDLFGTSINAGNILLSIFKILLIFGAFLYLVFAGLILRQIQLMSKTLQTSFTPVLWLFGLIHLVLSFGLLFYFLAL